MTDNGCWVSVAQASQTAGCGSIVRIILLLGFGAVLLAAVALLISDARLGAALACERASGVCTLTQQELLRTWTDRIPLAAMDRAEVRVPRGRGGSPQVWVVTAGGDYFFSDYVPRSNADKAAQQVNAFLGNQSAGTRLILAEDARAGYWLAWALIPVIVVLLVILGRVLFKKPHTPGRT
jgi:hypothetical protein